MNISVFRFSGLSALAVICTTLTNNAAFAHHAMDGDTPTNLMEGLISGIAHPIIGVDHLAFIIGIGIASAFLASRLITPLFFVGATLVGCILQIQGIQLPFAEIIIASSVVLIGVLIMSGVAIPNAAYLVLFAIAGLFHGWAYGESIIGAEQTPLFAYLLGFAVIQYAIAIICALLTRAIWQSATVQSVQLRLAGAAIAGFGAAFLVEHVESLLLPTVAS